MAQTKAHIKASAKYNAANYVPITIRIRPEQKKAIKAAADAAGVSVTQLILSRCLPDQQITTADDSGTE